jgi:hypothetical protein
VLVNGPSTRPGAPGLRSRVLSAEVWALVGVPLPTTLKA